MEIKEIKNYIKQQKLTYAQVASLSGLSLGTIKEVFSGRTKNPRLDTMNAICKGLGLDYEVPLQPTVINHDRRVIAIGHGIAREEYELSEEDAAIVRELINRLNQNKK